MTVWRENIQIKVNDLTYSTFVEVLKNWGNNPSNKKRYHNIS